MQKKTEVCDDESAAKIMEANDSYTTKAIGREIKNFDEQRWFGQVQHILKKGLLAKFEQNNVMFFGLLDLFDV